MTTVACNRFEMAADTYCQTGFRLPKIYRHKGELIGVSGDVADMLLFLQWYMGGKETEPDWKKKFDAVILRKDGIFLYDQRGQEIATHDDFWAEGSGRDFAVGAMAAGKSPADAVRIAARYDSGTKEPIEIRYLVSKKEPA